MDLVSLHVFRGEIFKTKITCFVSHNSRLITPPCTTPELKQFIIPLIIIFQTNSLKSVYLNTFEYLKHWTLQFNILQTNNSYKLT